MREPDNSEDLLAVLEAAFGGLVYDWPWPARWKPGRLDRKARRDEARINAALAVALLPPIDDGFRRRFYEEVRFGQADEDAGGYLWRCWCRAMQQPNMFLSRYGRGYEPGEAA